MKRILVFANKVEYGKELPHMDTDKFKVVHREGVGMIMSISEIDLDSVQAGVLEGGVLKKINNSSVPSYLNRRYYVHYIEAENG